MLNDSGQVAGYYLANGGYHGFIRGAGGSFTTFDVPVSIDTYSFALNNFGMAAGWYIASGQEHGFVRDPAGNIRTIDPPGGITTSLWALNDAGQVAGWYEDNNGVHGFIATPAANTVPTPASLTLLAVGAIGLLGHGWRKRLEAVVGDRETRV